MPRYFLHLLNSIGYAADEEGRELADLDVARRKAIEGIRSIVSEEVKDGLIDLRGRIDVADQDGRVLLVVRFSEAVELVTGELPEPGDGPVGA